MLRLSYTLLRLWHQQRLDEVLSYYTKRETITTPEMVIGSGWDHLVNESVKKNNCLPDEFGGLKLNKPSVQQKLEIKLDDETELVGVPDIIDTGDEIVYEIKTGVTPANTFLSSKQIEIYALLCQLKQITIRQIRVFRYNPYQRKYDWAMRWNTDNLACEAHDYIFDVAPDIRKYLTENEVKV